MVYESLIVPVSLLGIVLIVTYVFYFRGRKKRYRDTIKQKNEILKRLQEIVNDTNSNK